MYHTRFLKAVSFHYSDGQDTKRPSVSKLQTISFLKPVKSHALNCSSVITLTNDLGEEFFYGDLTFDVTVNVSLESSAIRTSAIPQTLKTSIKVAEKELPWKLGNRAIPLNISIPIVDLQTAIKLLLKSNPDNLKASRKAFKTPKVLAYIQVRVHNPQLVSDKLGCDIKDSISEAYASFEGLVNTKSPTSVLITENLQFHDVISMPLQILTLDHYEFNSNSNIINSERYSLRRLKPLNGKDEDLIIIEELGNGIERHLWNAGIQTMHLLPQIINQVQFSSDTPKILELGTGVGIISIALSKLMNEATIAATDLVDAEEVCAQNILLNKSSAVFSDLEWSGHEKKNDTDWDMIIVTDCTYNPTYYDDLINVMMREASSKTDIVIAHKIREPQSEIKFFHTLNENFKTVNETWVHNLYESTYIGHYVKN